MKTAICKIYAEDGSKGTGFFCKIQEEIQEEIPDDIPEEISDKNSDKKLEKENYLKVLITNYHVINEKQKKIEISINNDNKYISILENKVL